MRNVGQIEAKFELSVWEPFFVTPDSGRIAVGESMQIHVDFKALQTGDHSRHMILHYDTGCILYVFVLISMDVISNFKENSLTEIVDLWSCLHCGGNMAEWLGWCMDLKSGDPEFKSRSDH